jgi:hypothetical protein
MLRNTAFQFESQQHYKLLYRGCIGLYTTVVFSLLHVAVKSCYSAGITKAWVIWKLSAERITETYELQET